MGALASRAYSQPTYTYRPTIERNFSCKYSMDFAQEVAFTGCTGVIVNTTNATEESITIEGAIYSTDRQRVEKLMLKYLIDWQDVTKCHYECAKLDFSDLSRCTVHVTITEGKSLSVASNIVKLYGAYNRVLICTPARNPNQIADTLINIEDFSADNVTITPDTCYITCITRARIARLVYDVKPKSSVGMDDCTICEFAMRCADHLGVMINGTSVERDSIVNAPTLEMITITTTPVKVMVRHSSGRSNVQDVTEEHPDAPHLSVTADVADVTYYYRPSE